MKASLSRTLVGLLAAAGLIGASVNAQAATATGNFNVNITLTSKCEINSTAAATGAVPDYQLSALLMAIFWRGLDAGETSALTSAIVSGTSPGCSGSRFIVAFLPVHRSIAAM